MNNMSGASSRDDESLTEEFIFEVPITNFKPVISNNELNDANKEPSTAFDDPKTSGKILKEKAIVFDDDTSKETLVTVDVPKSSSEESSAANYLDKTKAKDYVFYNKKGYIKDTDNIIDLDEAETKNVVLDGNKTDSDNILDENRVDSDGVIVLDGNKTDSEGVIVLDGNKTDSESTIILDDDEINQFTERLPKLDVIIDVEKDTFCIESNSTKPKKKRTEYNEIYKENVFLAELIEKCLDMENTEGMTRVIDRTLLRIYKSVDETYKKSNAFRKALSRTIMLLDTEPDKKFSHLKNFCDELKQHIVKKRVPFITLEEKTDTEQSTSSIPSKRRRVDVVINLDDDYITDAPQLNSSISNHRKQIRPIEVVNPPIEIDDDDSSSDVFINDGYNVTISPHHNANKENSKMKHKNKKHKKHKRKKGKPRNKDLSNSDRNQNDAISGIVISQIMSCADQDINSGSEPTVLLEPRLDLGRNGILEPELLLEPRLAVAVNTAEVNQARIKEIELKLSNLKKKLEKLEEAEVTTNCLLSPYLMAEETKKFIVTLYKELCQLTGTEVTKRHEVRLKVVPGHPEGPVRCLEEFLNANIDVEGNPPFPDMHDVMQCVIAANERYDMRWSRPQIMNEAHALFIQLGRSMQKRRQKREWKDLMGFVKQETPDPADDDPALQARLMENTRIARRNEDELLDRFTKIEHGLVPHSDPELMVSMQSEESDQDSDVDPQATTNRTDNIMNPIGTDLSNQPDGSKRIGETFGCGSTVTVSGGNIIIQPLVKLSDNPVQSALNAVGHKPASNTDFTLYCSKTHSVSIPLDKQTNHLANDKFIDMDKTENIGPNSNLTKESSVVQSSCNNNDDFANAAKLAKEIMSLVQADLSAETCKATEKQFNDQYSYLDAFKMFNAKLKLTKLDLNGYVKKNDQCFTKSVSKSTTSNESKQNGETEESYQILTHTTRYKSIVTNTESIKNEETGKELGTAFENNIVEANSVTKDSTKDTTDDENVENIVKPEPLDIPSMLEELGQGYTATIFDIEDPFLVIEISDSSDSEDDL